MVTFNKDGSIRKKPGRKPKVPTEHLYTYPSLTHRQTSILMGCMEKAMGAEMMVDGEPVTSQEWLALATALARGIH